MGDLDPATVSTVMTGADVFFVLIGAILVFAMHGGFAFLEVGTVRRKNQVNALVKILVDFSISTIAYFSMAVLLWPSRADKYFRLTTPDMIDDGDDNL